MVVKTSLACTLRGKADFVLHYNSFVRKIGFIILIVFTAGCGAQGEGKVVETPTASIVTSTLVPSPTSPPSQTPLPPPPTPTIVPAQGTTSTQVNVRAEPNTAAEVLGIIPANTPVEIIGKDAVENWFLINYSQSPDGKGWVAAQFITTGVKPEVPVIGYGADSEGAATAIVQQQINVRSGPGTSFNSLGTLNAQDIVTLTGKEANGAWLQIEFATGPDGRGWINAAFVQANGVESLPIVAEGNVVVGTGTPTITPIPAEPTVIPARADGDSVVAPAVNVALTASGTRSFQYTSDVSSPEGDAEDWIQFTTFTPYLNIELECTGSGSYVVELLQNNSASQSLVCGKNILVSVDPQAVYAVHFQSAPAGGLHYTRYTLRVEAISP